MNAIYFVLDHVEISGLDTWFKGFIKRLESYQTESIKITRDPDAASLIVFLSSGIIRKKIFNRNRIKQHPLYKRYPDRCFIWCTEDKPLDYLPGFYASMPRQRFKSNRHKAFVYYELPTTEVDASEKIEKSLLYNFVGGPTAKVRETLFCMEHPNDAYVVKKKNSNHNNPATAASKAQFAKILQRSRFTLCPRGVGTSSYRLFEAMRFGSIPVIIADDLILPDGPDWPACSIRIAERDVACVDEILRAMTDVEPMGENAREYYELYFSQETLLKNIVRLSTSIQSSCTRPSSNWNFYLGQADALAIRTKKRLIKALGS